MESRIPFKIEKNPSLDPRSPFFCSQIPLYRSMAPQDAEVEALGMPTNRFGAPEMTRSARKIARIGKKTVDENLYRIETAHISVKK